MAVTFKILNEINEMFNRYRESMEFSSEVYPEANNISVSVIVPTRNEERNIKRLLASLRFLRYRNIEVIVADYMSNDNSDCRREG